MENTGERIQFSILGETVGKRTVTGLELHSYHDHHHYYSYHLLNLFYMTSTLFALSHFTLVIMLQGS